MPFLCIFSLLLITFLLNLISDGLCLDLVMLRPKYSLILLSQCGALGIRRRYSEGPTVLDVLWAVRPSDGWRLDDQIKV